MQVKKKLQEPRTWTNSLIKLLKRRNMDTRFGAWHINSLYSPSSLVTVIRTIKSIS